MLRSFRGQSVMDLEGGKESQAAVMMHRVVPLEEVDAEGPGVLDRATPVVVIESDMGECAVIVIM